MCDWVLIIPVSISVESIIINVDSVITNNINRKMINLRQEKIGSENDASQVPK